MRLTYDLNHDRLIRGLHAPVEVARIELKSSTSGPIEVVFVRPLISAEELATPLTIKFGVKEVGAHTDDFLVSNWDGAEWAHTLSGEDEDAVYSLPVAWNTEELIELLDAASTGYLDLAGELKITSNGNVNASLNFGVRVFRSYINGDEAADSPTPLEGDYATEAALQDHLADTANPHAVTKAQVGLANADNTSDANKPISTATQAALDAKASAAGLAAHLADTANPHAVTKAQVGLANADNTSDANKPISTATQAALDLKQNAATALTTTTGILYLPQISLLTGGNPECLDSIPTVGVSVPRLVCIVIAGALRTFMLEEGSTPEDGDGTIHPDDHNDPANLKIWTSVA